MSSAISGSLATGRSIGVLMIGTGFVPSRQRFTRITGFERRLQELGYAFGEDGGGSDSAGRPIRLIYRWAEPWESVTVAAEAAALVHDEFTVLVASGTVLTLALKQRTSTIPIVMICDDGDCVGAGLVADLDHPGTNVTGSTSAVANLSGRRLELLREAVPHLSRLGVLYNPDVPDKTSDLAGLQETARRLEVAPICLAARRPADLPAAFDAAVRERVDALLTLSDALTFQHRRQIVGLAAQHVLPTSYTHRSSVLSGGLMAYGPNMDDLYVRAADFVDAVLRGAAPSSLPVAQPTAFEFTLNPRAAAALDLTLPASLLAKVDALLP